MKPDPDSWLDAFTAEDLADPELPALDDAVQRISANHERPSPAPTLQPRRTWLWLGVLAAAAILAFVISQRTPNPPTEPAPATHPVADAAAAPVAAPPSRKVLEPVLAQDAVADVAAEIAPVEHEVLEASEVPEASNVAEASEASEVLAGLLPEKGAELAIAGDTAILTSGTLRYIHDEHHKPGVRKVRWDQLSLTAVPVGTAFSTSAGKLVAAILVSGGRVEVVRDSGDVLRELRPGGELVAVPALDESGVTLIATAGMALNEIGDHVPDDCLCHVQDVVAAVAQVRMQALRNNDSNRGED